MLSIITSITSVLGIIGFIINVPIIIYIGGIVYILETINGLVTGELRNITLTIITLIISIVISNICNYSILQGVCFGLCIESVLMTLLSLVLFFFVKR